MSPGIEIEPQVGLGRVVSDDVLDRDNAVPFWPIAVLEVLAEKLKDLLLRGMALLEFFAEPAVKGPRSFLVQLEQSSLRGIGITVPQGDKDRLDVRRGPAYDPKHVLSASRI